MSRKVSELVSSRIGNAITNVNTWGGIIYNVKSYGAVGDAVTNDAAAILLAITAAITAGSGEIHFPPGTYVVNSELTITGASNLKFKGNGLIKLNAAGACFKLAGTCDNITFDGLRFTGDGTTAMATQGAITSVSGQTLSNIKFINCKFYDLPFGIYQNSESSGSCTDYLYLGCNFKNIVGGASGSGLGIAISGGDTTPVNSLVLGCTFDDTHRHAFYVSSGSGVRVIGNHFRNHRADNHDELFISLGALQLTRCKDIAAVGNTFENCYEASVHLGTDDLTREADDILIANNTFVNSRRFDISIGNDNPDTSGQTKNIRIIGNKIRRADNAEVSIYIQSANGLTVTENEIDASILTVSHFGMININALGTTNPSDDYHFKRNKIKMPTTGTSRCFNVSAVDTTTTKVSILDNDVIAVTAIFANSTITNPNLLYDFRKISTGTAIPTAGTWTRGDVMIITAAAQGLPCEYECSSDGTPGTWRMTKQRGIIKMTTAARPSTLTASEAGFMYFDTTIDADGKTVWWTGTAYVDATGTVV